MARAPISNRRCAEDDGDMTDVPGSLSLVFSTSPTLFSDWLHLLKQVMLPSTEFLLGKFCYCDINTGVLVRWYVETALTLWDGLSENLKRAAAANLKNYGTGNEKENLTSEVIRFIIIWFLWPENLDA